MHNTAKFPMDAHLDYGTIHIDKHKLLEIIDKLYCEIYQ